MNKNNKTALTFFMLFIGMFAFAFAAFPLYSIFCKMTGYGGTPTTALQPSTSLGNNIMTVRFNADIASDLSWKFYPTQKQQNVTVGENKLAFFTAENTANHEVSGISSFNVTPEAAGKYFSKVQCFCFEKQTLKAGEKVQMPVSYYIDPLIEKDLDLKNINTITLSYTFFKVD